MSCGWGEGGARPTREGTRGNCTPLAQFLIAAKNPRIVLAPRVSVITRLGEFRVWHEMKSFSLLRMRKRRKREKGTSVGQRDGQVAGHSIIAGGSRSCNSGSVPFFRLDPPAAFFLPLYFSQPRGIPDNYTDLVLSFSF